MEDTRFNDEIAPLLIDGETVLGCYQDVRDHVIFTDKIIISVNVQGITGKISAFSVETTGILDLDS